ncbi:MAG TPA: HAMP domain-containing sensor histidine kinase [Candidatus Saccharimonadales bacterium]|nr:HAMP domain-containing sensor histidine kinase [Candidatus Saccharimonadales bacterium]
MGSREYEKKAMSHQGFHLHKNTRILYGAENAVGKGVEFMKNTKHKMDITFDHRAPSIVIKIPQYYNGYQDILSRGGKIRCITIITQENLAYCEELIKIVTELRHLDNLKGGIAINDHEYMATTVLQEAQPLTEVIYSNVDEVVEQGQFVFDTLWKNAIPAKQKIRELKEGIKSYETKLIEESSDSLIEDVISQILFNATEINICTSIEGLKYNKNYLTRPLFSLLESKKEVPKRIRIIVEINRDNFEMVKRLRNLGIEVKHSKDVFSINYIVTDSDLAVAIKKTGKNAPGDSILYSNDPSYLEHFSKGFDEVWRNGKDPGRIIKSLEDETELSFIKTIDDPMESINLVKTLMMSAETEILGILPSFNSFLRQVDIGTLQVLKNIALTKRNLDIRILIAEEMDENKQKQIKTIFDKFNDQDFDTNEINDIQLEYRFDGVDNFRLKLLNSKLFTEIGFLIVDKKKSLLIESRNIPTMDMLQSIGLSSYSNSFRISKSYASIFEALWNQSELYDKLKVQDRLQKEFINIAAHELRNPVQLLLGFSDILMNSKGNIESCNKFIITINQSTKRLARLIDKVLDVTQLENELLILNKEIFNLEQLVVEIVKEYNNNIHLLNKKSIEIEYVSENSISEDKINPQKKEFGLIYADRIRVIQVIMNLLENAVEFTKDGKIQLKLYQNQDSNELLLSVIDSGSGIDPEVLPKLFTKFVSKSRKGTGLGLYISRKIIEAHNGRVWAENCYDTNNKVIGSKFTFSIPARK